MNSPANQQQVAGSHYRSDFQHWDFVHSVLYDDYLLGQATKYLTRWRKKNGIEDLKKARHYISKLIERCATEQVMSMNLRHAARARPISEVVAEVNAFYAANFPDLARGIEYDLFQILATWSSRSDLNSALSWLDVFIHHIEGGK